MADSSINRAPLRRGRSLFRGALVLVGLIIMGWVYFFRWPAAEVLEHPDPAVRVAALRRLPSRMHVDLIVRALKDENADVRLTAAMKLEGSEWEGEKRTEPLIEALRDPHAGVRRQAAWSLQSIGYHAGPALCKALQDPDTNVRAGAAFALSDFYAKAEHWRPPDQRRAIALALSRVLKEDLSPVVRRNAVHSLRLWGLETPEDVQVGVEALRAALQDEDAEIRSAAAWKLERIEPVKQSGDGR